MVSRSGNGRAREAKDEELVARYRAGEAAALDELVDRYTPVLYNLIYRFTGDRAEAENLTQEAWLRIWSALPRIKLDLPVKPYFLRVALNLCRSWAVDSHRSLVDLDLAEAQDILGEEADTALERMSQAELQARVQAAIEKLSPMYRTVIILRYSQDLSYEEIARVLELPLNTVRTHLRRAKGRLNELLREESGRL